MVIFVLALALIGQAAGWSYTVTVKTATIESPGSDLNLTVTMEGKGGNRITHVLQREAGSRARRDATGTGWCEYADSYLYTYSSGTSSYTDLSSAQAACLERDDCGGITQEPYNSDRYTLRVGPDLYEGLSPTDEISWVVCDEGGDGDLSTQYGDLSYRYNVDGARSGSSDDATSVITCDEGFVVSYCEVKTGSLGYGSDGAHVSISGDTCTAVNAGGGSGVNAHATCTQNTESSDGLPYYNYQQDQGTSASLECPSGYSPHLCTVHSPWKENLRNNDNFNDVGVASNASQCEIDDCINWCRVSLICTRDEVKPDGETRLGAGIVSPTVDIIGDDGFTTGSTDIFYIEDDVKLGTLLYVNISSGSDNAWQLDWMLVETEGLPNIARYVYNTETLHLSTDSSDDNGKAVDLLQMEVQGTETYYLVVETANKTEAGSDAIHVKAIIHGTNDVYTGYLDNEGRDDFVVGENDVFIFPGMGLAGRLECLTLLCWGDDSWEFDWIVVFSIKSYTQPPRVFWNNDTVMTTNSEEGVNEYHVCRNDNQWGSEVELLELE